MPNKSLPFQNRVQQAMNKVFIGLGSNLDSPLNHIQEAIQTLQQHPDVSNWQVSSLYSSKPVGPQDQPDYINAVACFNTPLAPIAVLDMLQNIEQDHQRVREQYWGPRTLDLDILLYNQETIAQPRLTIPHPFMLERGFVLKPLAELEPTLTLFNGNPINEQLSQLDTSDLVCL